jgi:hypothetical protein
MKRLLLCIVSVTFGFVGGSSIRFTERWQHGYQRGYRVAIEHSHREAVREGHGHWERLADSTCFRWNEFRKDYFPDSPCSIPGLE